MALGNDNLNKLLGTSMLLGGLLLAATGCTKGASAGSFSGFEGDAPEISVSAISPTVDVAADGLEVNVIPEGEGMQVNIVAMQDFEATDELFFNVSFNPELAHSSEVKPQVETADGNVLSLAVEAAPGVIDFGAVSTVEGQMAVQPGDTVLSFHLNPGEGSPAKYVSAAGRNPSLSRARNLEFLRNGDGNWVLEWDYTNPGDNNQDGQVSINDITPIGVHYGERVANSWNDKRRHIDADRNGEINLGDLTSMSLNYGAQIFAYNIEMSEDGESDFIVVGQLVLDEEVEQEPGETKRFEYVFGAQYVEGAWYRVVPMDSNLRFGSASEAISEAGRRMDPVAVSKGDKALVTVYGQNMPASIAQANAIRVVFPASYEYVKESANAGKPGGMPNTPDGIWSTFADNLLFPPDAFHIVTDLGNGKKAIDFNVTTLVRRSPSAPDPFGDLINFRLESTAGDPLTLEFQVRSEDGVHRTYFADANEVNHDYGNSLGFRVN